MASNNQQPAQQDQSAAPAEQTNTIQRTICEDEDANNFDPNKQRQIELDEEKKLKAKHPFIQRPGSEFLQKRLQRGQKYFDSGDYNMAKASTNSNIKLPDNATPVTAIDSKVLNKRHWLDLYI